MQRRLDLLTFAIAAYGIVLATLTTLAGAGIGVGLLAGGEWAAAILGVLVMGFGWAFATPLLVTAWGLRRRAPWARIAAAVVSILLLADIPVGFCIGALGLVTLFDPETRAAFGEGEQPELVLALAEARRAQARMARQLARL